MAPGQRDIGGAEPTDLLYVRSRDATERLSTPDVNAVDVHRELRL